MKIYILLLIVLLLLFCSKSIKAQDYNQFSEEELRESLGLEHVKIPIHAYLEIARAFEGKWLDYRMRTNPQIPHEVWYDNENNQPRDFYKVVLNDTINPRLFELIYTIRKFPDSTYTGGLDGGLGYHYYLVEKKENVFVKKFDGDNYPDRNGSPDSIKVNAYSELYPYDNYFVFYYDPNRGEPFARAIGGNIAWDAMPYRYNLPYGYINARLVQYQVKDPIYYGGFLQLEKGIRGDTLDLNKYKEYYVARKSLLSNGPILISTPIWNYDSGMSYDDEIEIIYYSRCPALTGDPKKRVICEVKYCIKPHVTDITERYPTIRNLSEEERSIVVGGNMRFFIDWCVDIKDLLEVDSEGRLF